MNTDLSTIGRTAQKAGLNFPDKLLTRFLPSQAKEHAGPGRAAGIKTITRDIPCRGTERFDV